MKKIFLTALICFSTSYPIESSVLFVCHSLTEVELLNVLITAELNRKKKDQEPQIMDSKEKCDVDLVCYMENISNVKLVDQKRLLDVLIAAEFDRERKNRQHQVTDPKEKCDLDLACYMENIFHGKLVDLKILQSILRRGANVNVVNMYKLSPLMTMCTEPMFSPSTMTVNVIKTLLQHSANTNQECIRKSSPWKQLLMKTKSVCNQAALAVPFIEAGAHVKPEHIVTVISAINEAYKLVSDSRWTTYLLLDGKTIQQDFLKRYRIQKDTQWLINHKHAESTDFNFSLVPRLQDLCLAKIATMDLRK